MQRAKAIETAARQQQRGLTGDELAEVARLKAQADAAMQEAGRRGSSSDVTADFRGLGTNLGTISKSVQ
jgi:hypothetical protein